jgi:hypothetical protein
MSIMLENIDMTNVNTFINFGVTKTNHVDPPNSIPPLLPGLTAPTITHDKAENCLVA